MSSLTGFGIMAYWGPRFETSALRCSLSVAIPTRLDDALIVRVHAGCYAPVKVGFANTADLETKPLNAVDARFITTLTSALLAMADVWMRRGVPRIPGTSFRCGRSLDPGNCIFAWHESLIYPRALRRW